MYSETLVQRALAVGAAKEDVDWAFTEGIQEAKLSNIIANLEKTKKPSRERYVNLRLLVAELTYVRPEPRPVPKVLEATTPTTTTAPSAKPKPAPAPTTLKITDPTFFQTQESLFLVCPKSGTYGVIKVQGTYSRNAGETVRLVAQALRSMDNESFEYHVRALQSLYVVRSTQAAEPTQPLVSLGRVIRVWPLEKSYRRGDTEVSDSRPRGEQLDWEVLPAGWWNRRHASQLDDGGIGLVTDWDEDRLRFLDSLSPRMRYSGSHLGQRLYFVAVFDKLVVADTGEFGNALYTLVCADDRWKSVFKRTKAEALRLGARRIVHRGNWQGRVLTLMNKKAVRKLNSA
jgi:hypothetical protein